MSAASAAPTATAGVSPQLLLEDLTLLLDFAQLGLQGGHGTAAARHLCQCDGALPCLCGRQGGRQEEGGSE